METSRPKGGRHDCKQENARQRGKLSEGVGGEGRGDINIVEKWKLKVEREEEAVAEFMFKRKCWIR